MIYFDQPARGQLIRKFHRFSTESSGSLFIGQAEKLGRNYRHYRYLLQLFTRKKDNPPP
jgi:chemotaxis methyl-accepting protein methylase